MCQPWGWAGLGAVAEESGFDPDGENVHVSCGCAVCESVGNSSPNDHETTEVLYSRPFSSHKCGLLGRHLYNTLSY